MIYTFVGDNLNKKKEAIDALVADYPDTQVLVVNQFNFNNEEFGNFIAGGDIFSQKYLVIMDSLLESNFADDILGKIEAIKKSENIFVFKQISLLKKPTDLLKKHSKVFENFSLQKNKIEKFNIFSITDSFGARDKKNTWILMQKALAEGVKSEDILNILIWQAKNLLKVQKSKHAMDTDLSPFVYNKTKNQIRNFKELELKNISRALAELFHKSHLGSDLTSNLELFILKSL